MGPCKLVVVRPRTDGKVIAPGCASESVPEKPAGSPKITSDIPKRRGSDDKNAVAIVKSVSQLGCVSQDSDALVSQGRMSRRNPMQKVLVPIQRVRFTKSTLCQASLREKKGPSLRKVNVKVLRFEGSPMNRLKDSSDVPEARLGILPKIFAISEKKTRLHSTFPRRNGYSGCVSKGARGKRVCS